MAGRPSILYACIHNSGRSVAAHVLTEHYAADRVAVRSAGSDPANDVNPVVAQVLAERGLSVTDHIPTRLDRDIVESSDIVITMGCGESCPVFPGKRYEDWNVEDPAGQDIEPVRRIVDDLDARIQLLLNQLLSVGEIVQPPQDHQPRGDVGPDVPRQRGADA
jgi:arsenate reductase